MQATIGEINIFCTNLQESLDFYCGVLGFVRGEDEQGAVHLWCGNQSILLLPFANQPASAEPYGQYATISFDLLVKDIEKTVAHLQQHNIEFEKPLGNDRHVFIRDPDGLILEVIETNVN